MNNERCAVLVPIGTSLEPETEQLLGALASRGYAVLTLRGSSQVDLARSTLAADALREGFEETLWIDADMSFDPDDVDKIRALGPFVAGFYPCKGPKQFAGKLKASGTPVRFGEGGGLVEVEYCGMGFTYVRAEVYAAIAKQGLPVCSGGYGGKTLYPFFLPLLVPDGDMQCYLSEDYSFCHRATAAGFPPVVDTRIKVGHIGRYRYTWDDLLPDMVLSTLEVAQGSDGRITAVSAMSVPMPPTKATETMNDSQIYEALGRKQAAFEQLDSEYTKLLGVITRLKAGEFTLEQLAIDQKARSWSIFEPTAIVPEAIKQRMNGDLANAGHDG